ncbi:Uncharacterised protein [Mycobacterium tuberculosis]|uniref:Uncharacterized protein n=1 Tax=Mycobacterium tuberculosis TaxID=1773 RepID=A0A0U0SRZ0_MYCTX|nr:Uncharacterised protein [Mycobacterium tuberculosis]CKU10791.1 Uncharacterised protein [Mycobacterium tuberculosis]COW99972.1 Uncharacterised protein [Mycobacterium tuberculosis]COX45278.1 Uncharacterised protein [Mycobacterium tuberculosis]
MVDITKLGGHVTPGKPARQIPHPDEFSQLGRRPVVRLCCEIAGMAHLADGGPTPDEFGQQRRGHHTAAGGDQLGRRVGGGGIGFGVGCQRLEQGRLRGEGPRRGFVAG